MAKEKEILTDNKVENKRLNDVISKLEQTYGKGTIQKLGDKPNNYDVISSGSLKLDSILGIMGYARGRIVEIYGPESSGKTTIAIHAIVSAQQKGLRCAIVDVECAFDINYAEALGINVDELYISQPSSGDDALNIIHELTTSGAFGLIILDSVGGLISKKEIDGDIGDANVGLIARLMSSAMRKLVPAAQQTNTLLIFINQIRDKIGGMGYGPQTTTTGGWALKFACSQRLEVKRVGTDKSGDEAISNRTKIKCTKNKLGSPYRECEVSILFGEGIDKYQEILDMAIELNIAKKSGSWYSYGDTKLGQGAEAVKSLLKDNPELFEEIEKKVKDLYDKA